MGADSTMQPVVSMRNISKRFFGVAALASVDFDMRPGEVHALIGENGAGKSTLMNILAGELLADEGEIEAAGRPVAIRAAADALALGIRVVFQELSLCENMSVAENVLMPHIVRRTRLGPVRRQRAADEARPVLARVGQGDLDPRTPVRQLSLSRKQLVEIARAISEDVRVLVLDEPNSALTAAESELLFDVIERMRAEGVAIVYVSHHLDEVLRLADRITVLRDGQRIITIEDPSTTSVDDLVRHMVGRNLGPQARQAPANAPRRAARLVVRGLSVPGQLRGLDFDLCEGEILGIAGLADSGMDTLPEAVFGLVSRQGDVSVEGQALSGRGPAEALRAGMAYVPADRRNGGALLKMSVTENAVASALDGFARSGVLQKRRMRGAAQEYVRKLDARIARLDQALGTLSGGNQQKVILGRSLLTHPGVLIVHEPTRGIDVGAKAEIHRLLRGLAEDGMAVLMVSSDLPEIVTQSDRVLVLAGGVLSAELAGEEITEEAVMQAATEFAAA